MKQALVCTACDTIILKSVGTELKVRSKVLVFKEGGAFAVCKGCNSEVPVPLRVDTDMMKSISSSSRLKLYVEK